MERKFLLKTPGLFGSAVIYALVAGSLFYLACRFTGMLIVGNFDAGNQYFIGVITAILFFFSVYLPYRTFRFDVLRVYDDRSIDVYSSWGYYKQTIYYNQIVAWGEYKSNSKSVGYVTKFYFDQSEYAISSGLYDQYDWIRDTMTLDKPQKSIKAPKNVSLIIFVVSYLVFLFAFIGAITYHYLKIGKTIYSTDLTTVKGVIVNMPKVHLNYHTRSRTTQEINIMLKNYPGIIFFITEAAFRATNVNDFLQNVRPGDSLNIDVLTSDYHEIVVKDAPAIWYHSKNRIDVYGLRRHFFDDLKLDDFNEENKILPTEYYLFGFIFIFFGIFFFLVLIKLLFKKQEI